MLPAEKMDINKQLEAYKAEKANLLMPSIHIAGLSEFHKPVLEVVQLSSNPEDGDVYPHDNADPGPKKKWRLTKQALMKLSVCSGVIWSPNETRRIDDNSNRDYIAYRAVGGIKKADGQLVFFSGDYDIDFEVLEEELKDQYQRRAKDLAKGQGQNKRKATDEEKEEYVDYCVRRDMLQKRKFKLRLCEAGAMNRVLRMLLNIKQAYTTEELSKPFVMARIVFQPDFTDKQVRQQFIDASIKSMTGIYGPNAAAAVPDKTEPIDITPIDDKPDDQTGENGNGTNGQGPQETQQTEPAGDSLESRLQDFKDMNVYDQENALYKVAKERDYNIKEWLVAAKKASPRDLTPEKRVALYQHIINLPAPTAKDDDIPFDLGRK